MSSPLLRIGIAGEGRASPIHPDRLLAEDGLRVVGIADGDGETARRTVSRVPARACEAPAEAFEVDRDPLKKPDPDALVVFNPFLATYRPAMDALQAGRHVLVEKPLSASVQEAVDVAGLARGRGRKVPVGHQYRLRPCPIGVRRRLAEGSVGPLRLCTTVVAQPWREEDGGGHLTDALIWTISQATVKTSEFQARLIPEPGPDVVAAVAVRPSDGTPATLGVCEARDSSRFRIDGYGERGRIRATDQTLEKRMGGGSSGRVERPAAAGPASMDGDFVSGVVGGSPVRCPAEKAFDTVRLLEAGARSSATGQLVRLT